MTDMPEKPCKTPRRRKPLSPHYQANNEGGHGNPPVKHQFRGQPGPGRPSGGTTLATAMRKLMKEQVTATANGKQIKISMVEAITKRVGKEILTGSMRALELGVELAEKYGPTEVDRMNMTDFFKGFTHLEIKILRSLFMRGNNNQSPLPPDHVGANMVGNYRIFMREDGFIGIEKLD